MPNSVIIEITVVNVSWPKGHTFPVTVWFNEDGTPYLFGIDSMVHEWRLTADDKARAVAALSQKEAA